ncbi:MAG TPA: thioredoxin family protein [Candidatus Acidoferrales bacterium]|nr:thioredoxin family protein [Candidatus Acidoferrales bacterium]
MSTAAGKSGQHPVVGVAEWLVARKELLKKEKELTHLRDEISRLRLELPWEKIEKKYVFEGPKGKRTLADLFDGRSQLMIYHFMLGPGWKEGCPSCSYLADHFDGMRVHLAARDIHLAVVSRAPWPEIEAFQQRMEWKFPWVSSNGTDFNFDYQVSATPGTKADEKVPYNYEMQVFPAEERPGLSAFYKDGGEIFHTYSTYARGLDILVGAYNFIDMSPLGRREQGLKHTMAGVRHHDRYGEGLVSLG